MGTQGGNRPLARTVIAPFNTAGFAHSIARCTYRVIKKRRILPGG